MRVLVVTIVHDPRDARIAARQIPALLAAGHEVTYAAPFAEIGGVGHDLPPDVDLRAVPRARGRRRRAALTAVRRLLRDAAGRHDLVLLHDPELLLVARPREVPTVWDVHEDAPASIAERDYLPRPVRRFASASLRLLERRAERRVHLILAEAGYAARFDRTHPVVPNVPLVGERPSTPVERRVVYVGRVSVGRGAREMVELARRLPDVTVDVVGWADDDVVPLLRDAPANLRWTGPDHVPNDQALARLDGAAAGLSLLHDLPNYRVSRPTKVLEYMAHGVPVVTTPLPHATDLVERARGGRVVPFGDVDAAVGAVRRFVDDPDSAQATGLRGWELVRDRHDWHQEGPRFVALLEAWAR